jgi:hypothetical protein
VQKKPVRRLTRVLTTVEIDREGADEIAVALAVVDHQWLQKLPEGLKIWRNRKLLY